LQSDAVEVLANAASVDFALVEAAYTVTRLIQEFPDIKLPEGEVIEQVGVEKQTMTLVLSITDGCKVQIA
jgi:hypothetical protein